MSSQLRIRSLLLPVAAAITLAAQVVWPSPVWKGLLTAFGGVWLISYFWARALQKHIRLERAMRYGWAQVGDRLEEQFVLGNSGWMPATYVELSDESTLPGYSVALATGVDGWSQNAWRTSGSCMRRGVFTLGGTRLVTGDPLGIYQVVFAYPEAVTLTVMPPVLTLPFRPKTSGGWQGEGRPRPHANEETLSAETVRAYVPGDSLRLVHWPTSARRGEPYVRVLEGAPASDWWIVMDCDHSVQAGPDEGENTVELGVILAASLADRGLRSHRAIGLIAAAEQPIWMRPEQGEHQRWEIMRALAKLRSGETNLALVLESASPALGRQANIIVVTASARADWVNALIKLAWSGMSASAVLIDPSTFGSEANMLQVQQLLGEAGISSETVGSELLRRPEAHPGPTGQWEWRILPTGKAVPVRRPTDMTWKELR